MLISRDGRRQSSAPAVSYERGEVPLGADFTLDEIATARRTRAFDRLLGLFEERGNPGWDGADADPLSIFTFVLARDFLLALPPAFPSPDVSAEVDDGVTFDWLQNDGDTFSVSVYGDGEGVWAAVLDGDVVSGEFDPHGGMPPEVTEILQEVCKD